MVPDDRTEKFRGFRETHARPQMKNYSIRSNFFSQTSVPVKQNTVYSLP